MNAQPQYAEPMQFHSSRLYPDHAAVAAVHEQCMTPPEASFVPAADAPTVDHNTLVVDAALDLLENVATTNTALYGAATCPVAVSDASLQHVMRYDNTVDVEPMTWFHSRTVPGISLRGLKNSLERKLDWVLDPAVPGIAVALMRRFSRRTGLPLTRAMMHRLFTVCLFVGAKTHQDKPPSVAILSDVSGLSKLDIARLEQALLRALDWNVLVDPSELPTFSSLGDGLAPSCEEVLSADADFIAS